MGRRKHLPQVYLVQKLRGREDKTLAIFADEENAQDFIEAAGLENKAIIVARTLWYGQPDFPGYNR